MGDDHPPGGDLWCDVRQPAGDVFVRQAVEPVAADAFGVESTRDRIGVGERTVAPMVRRVEAGDLWQLRKP